jgi:hypothetical protein
MFPQEELNQLARRKALLQARIALCRIECRVAAAELARPIGLIDRGVEIWRKISPFAKLVAVPAGLLLGRALGRRPSAGGGPRGKLATIVSLLPLLLRGVKLFAAARAAFAQTKKPAPGPS